jgi:hypothetical protein
MKSLIRKSIVFLGLATILYSFSNKPGGEGFEIYLGHQLLTQQYGTKVMDVQTFTVPGSSSEDLVVRYYHCGRAGIDRSISLKDDRGNILKQYHYPDGKTGMSVSVGSIRNVAMTTKNDELKVCYSSTEIPNGRTLAILKP